MGSIGNTIDAGIADALFGATRQAILGLFFDHPGERFYQRQIVRALGCGSGAVQRELDRLSKGGVLLRSVEGRQTYFEVNRECPIYGELHGLVRKTLGAAGVLRRALRPLESRIRVAFIFGSMARRQERSPSDIDLMIVGDALTLAEVSAPLRPVQEELRRELNPSVYRTAEFRRKLQEGHHFLTRVVEASKIFLIGGEHELGELGAVGMGQAASQQQAGNH